MKLEIIKIVKWSDTHWMPCGLNIRDKLWWRFMPGIVVNVRWPTDQPADPNFHYRPYLEQHVGRQGRDWNWGMADRDATDNRLTIKIRRKHEKYATMLSMMWS